MEMQDSLGIVPAMTFREIAHELGVSRQRVEQIYRRAIKKLQASTNRRDVLSILAEIEARRTVALPKKQRSAGGGESNNDYSQFALELRQIQGQAELG